MEIKPNNRLVTNLTINSLVSKPSYMEEDEWKYLIENIGKPLEVSSIDFCHKDWHNGVQGDISSFSIVYKGNCVLLFPEYMDYTLSLSVEGC